jgi:hypothetical protein
MLLLLVSANTLSKAKISLPEWCENMTTGKRNTLCKRSEVNLIKQKRMTQETAAQNIKNQLTSSTADEKTEELKRKPMHGQFYQNLERPSVDKEKSLAWLCS